MPLSFSFKVASISNSHQSLHVQMNFTNSLKVSQQTWTYEQLTSLVPLCKPRIVNCFILSRLDQFHIFNGIIWTFVIVQIPGLILCLCSVKKCFIKKMMKNFFQKKSFVWKNTYRVFGNEGQTESGSNLINFLPKILPKAF